MCEESKNKVKMLFYFILILLKFFPIIFMTCLNTYLQTNYHVPLNSQHIFADGILELFYKNYLYGNSIFFC
jgi:hypothetical protein